MPFTEIEYGAGVDAEVIVLAKSIGDLLVGVTLLSKTTN